jgi:ParB family chromosome partitioning protein
MSDDVQMIPIDRIRILNPRYRDRKKFELIVQSIKNLGLKKPIQVSLRAAGEAEGPGYDLVCGQGRIEAFKALGYSEIPAIVVEISKEDRLLRSLVENLARRFPAASDLLREIERLKEQGYTNTAIGKKLDICDSVVGGFLALKKAGEERLLEAALHGKIPLHVAMEIAKTKSVEDQRALLKAYEQGQLNYVSIRMAKRLMDQRRIFGKQRNRQGEKSRTTTVNSDGLVSAYRRESQKQKLLIKKAKICDEKMLFLVTAFTKLLADENFINLLRAEALFTLPKCLSMKIANAQKEAA